MAVQVWTTLGLFSVIIVKNGKGEKKSFVNLILQGNNDIFQDNF